MGRARTGTLQAEGESLETRCVHLLTESRNIFVLGWETHKDGTSTLHTVARKSRFTGMENHHNVKLHTNATCVIQFQCVSVRAILTRVYSLGLDRSIRLLVSKWHIPCYPPSSRCPPMGRLVMGSATALRPSARQADRLLSQRELPHHLVA